MSNITQSITAGIAALKLGISIDTIRRWDKKGLIKSFRDGRNDRMFSLEEIKRIQNKTQGDKKSKFKILKNKTVSKYTAIELFAGSVGHQYKQIGNAVPVNLGYYIGDTVIKMLDGEILEEEAPESIFAQQQLFALAA